VTHIVCSEIVQSLSNLNFLLGIEKGIGKLLSLSKCALDNLEAGNIAEKVADWLVWISRMRMWVLPGMDSSVAIVICAVWSA